jgi:hypothetical protein
MQSRTVIGPFNGSAYLDDTFVDRLLQVIGDYNISRDSGSGSSTVGGSSSSSTVGGSSGSNTVGGSSSSNPAGGTSDAASSSTPSALAGRPTQSHPSHPLNLSNLGSNPSNLSNLPNLSKPLFLFWAPHVAHTPLQVPAEYHAKFGFIQQPNRRTYAAMVNYIDTKVQ